MNRNYRSHGDSTLPPVLDAGQRPMQETHPSSNRLLVENREGCFDQRASAVTSTEGLDHYPTTTSTTFQGAQGVNISGQPNFVNIGTVNNSNNPEGSQQGFGNFEQFVSFDALHDSSVQDFDRYVDQGTREKTLRRFREWIDNPDSAKAGGVVWLHGPAGIGKTAIALEVARTLQKQKKVVASFFFHRLDASRNDGNRLFTTLAWQLAVSIPDMKNHIIHSLNERPDLPKKGVEAQFEHLIARPFTAVMKAISTIQPCSLVVIIDGIDECAKVQLQQRVLRVIGDAICDRRFPLRFIISSRPEAHIRETFNQLSCPILYIDLTKFSPAEEIRKKEEELKRWEQELKLKEEERKLKERESEITKREKENWHLAEETRLKAEEIKSREEELGEKLKNEERKLKGRESEITKREEENWHLAEETRLKAEEIKSREEELKKYKEELERREAECRVEGEKQQARSRRMEEEVRRQKLEIEKKEGGVTRREEATRQKIKSQEKARLQEVEKKFLLWFEWRQEEERLQTPEWRGGSSRLEETRQQQTHLLEAKKRLEQLEGALFPELKVERRRQLEKETRWQPQLEKGTWRQWRGKIWHHVLLLLLLRVRVRVLQLVLLLRVRLLLLLLLLLLRLLRL